MGGKGARALPRHQVTLSAFYVAREPVNMGLFRQFLRETGSTGNIEEVGPANENPVFQDHEQWKRLPALCRQSPTDQHAISAESWILADAFAKWLSQKEGRSFELITEAQWEYVSRAGVQGDQDFWWEGDQPSSLGCWLPDPDYSETGPERSGGSLAALYPANPLGLRIADFDPWTRDWFGPYSNEAQTDPIGPPSSASGRKVVRDYTLTDRLPHAPEECEGGIWLVTQPLASDRHPSLPPDPGPTPPPPTIVDLPQKTLDCGHGITLILRQIPAGHYVMGHAERDRPWTWDWPETPFDMTAYWLGVTDVTQAQFRAVTGVNPSLIKGDDLPVHSLEVAEMLAFCDLLTTRERAAGRLAADEEYRLPTEAEWERAALAGARTRYAHGDDPRQLHWYAWYDDLDGPHPVAKKLPNQWGFSDMEGNILQVLCEPMFKLPGTLESANWAPYPQGTCWANWFSARGGAWNMGAIACEPSIRRAINGSSRTYHMGFRLCLGKSLPPFISSATTFCTFDRAPYRNSATYAAIMQSAPQEWPSRLLKNPPILTRRL
jgi:formylglycine-generating enzyme required for sulfatase activity